MYITLTIRVIAHCSQVYYTSTKQGRSSGYFKSFTWNWNSSLSKPSAKSHIIQMTG